MTRLSASVVVLWCLFVTPLAAQRPTPGERWAASDRALPSSVGAMLRDLGVPTHVEWTPDGRLRYVTPDRRAIRVLDPATGESSVAFHVRDVPGVDGIDDVAPLAEEVARLLVTADGTSVVLDPGEGTVVEADSALVAAAERSRPRPLGRGLFRHRAPLREVPSPDGLRLVGTDEADVYLRSVPSGERRRLTDDGTDEDRWSVGGARWAPGGGKIAVRRIDRRGVPTVPIVDWTTEGEPVTRVEYSRAGEPIPRHEIHVIDTGTGSRVRLDLDDEDAPYLHVAGWSPDGATVYLLRMTRLMDRLDLVAADVSTGRARTVLTETSDTFIGGLPFLHGYHDALEREAWVRFLPEGDGFLWTSSRDGHRRIYRYEMDGTLLAPLTPPGWISRLEAVDAGHGRIWFTASTDPDGRPGHRALYHVPLTGGEPVLVGGGPRVPSPMFSPGMEHVLVTRSGLERPPAIELRADDGTRVITVWEVDPANPERWGWTPPEQFVVKAADGETDLHGHLHRPSGFDPSGSYPVVEMIYAGPQVRVVEPTVASRGAPRARALAELGFVVVLLDARGTPGRGKAFQDVVHGAFGGHEIADHAAGLRQLAADRPWMDLDRVGVVGHSWGGYFTIRAMLTAPDVYRAGWASAPNADLEDFRVSVEPYMGCLPETCPEAYRAGANTRLADRLEGDLVLVHGTADDDVPFGETMRMADALVEAGEEFDLLIFPDAHHGLAGRGYWWDAMRRFLVEALDAPAGPRSAVESP